MTNRRTLFKLTLFLACAAVIVWLGVGCGEPDYQCGTESLERANKTLEVFKKYRPLLLRYPDRLYVEIGFLRDEETGQRTKSWGIVIVVSEMVDQDTLPIDDRIPDKLEGVPVQIITSEIYNKVERFYGEGWISDVDPQSNIANDVWNKNRDFLRRYPFTSGSVVSSRDVEKEPGNRIWHIEVIVKEKVHNLGLPPTVRMPECLEGVPVKIIHR